jgi:hypothetical protein
MKQPKQHREKGPHYIWGVLVFILALASIIYLGSHSVNKYTIYYNNLIRSVSEQGDTVYSIDMIDQEAIEYSWYDSINAPRIATYDYYTNHKINADSICIIAVFKGSKLIYQNDLNTINLLK